MAGGGDDSVCRAALREAFGDSSDSESDAPAGSGRGRWRWEAVAGVRGLWLCAAFLSADEQARLLAAIQREGWFIDANNQAMRFGDLPSWAVELSTLIREAICVGDVNVGVSAEMANEDEDACPLPSDLLWREPFFDQMIGNRYNPGEGICAHVDLMRFDDGIAIVSLESACVMHFSQAEPTGTALDTLRQGDGEPRKFPVYLNPGSLVVMSGDARYLWKHEINRKPGAQLWDGRELEQHRRTSVTLRKLLASPS
ncbi:hypothetical protein SETIT_8G220200v2 [Setaria italica]|uniref:Fe2OG dioxygenase domain-containing protein n=1 Tax=Setaria italica TaxID=4555 RepID=K3ZMH9_SETIT|nr:alkylated DNA repair protein alkB homolog 8 [Setaria italica]RCV39387.1 hypothetical protein SETIT_8G220200v2 [Setaria italica]